MNEFIKNANNESYITVNNKKIKSKNSGITLIALVVTVVVMLMIAAVGVKTIKGDGGVITNSKIAKQKAEKSQIYDLIDNAYALSCKKGSGNADYNLFKKKLAKEFGKEGKDWSIYKESISTWVVTVHNRDRTVTKPIQVAGLPNQKEVDKSTVSFKVDDTELPSIDIKLGDSIGDALPTPTKEGFAFLGWYDAPTGGNKFTSNTKVNSKEFSVYAHWKNIPMGSSTITLIEDGTVFDVIDITTGNSIGNVLPTPTKEGFTFKGWFDAQTGGTQYNPSSIIKSKSLALYAHWERIGRVFVSYYEGGSSWYIEFNNSGTWLPVDFGGHFDGATNVGYLNPYVVYGDYWEIDNINSFRVKVIESPYYDNTNSGPSAGYTKMKTNALVDINDPNYFNYEYIEEEDYGLIGEVGVNGGTFISDSVSVDSDVWIDLYGWVGCLTGDMEIIVVEEDEEKKKKLKKKKIKDIKMGDILLSYDWINMKLIENKVVFTDANEKKFQSQYDKWIFEDGTIIKTCGKHELYNVEEKAFKYLKQWNIGEHAYKMDGTIVKLVGHEIVNETVQHYKITGENGTNYFVNDVLTGDKFCPRNIDLETLRKMTVFEI